MSKSGNGENRPWSPRLPFVARHRRMGRNASEDLVHLLPVHAPGSCAWMLTTVAWQRRHIGNLGKDVAEVFGTTMLGARLHVARTFQALSCAERASAMIWSSVVFRRRPAASAAR